MTGTAHLSSERGSRPAHTTVTTAENPAPYPVSVYLSTRRSRRTAGSCVHFSRPEVNIFHRCRPAIIYPPPAGKMRRGVRGGGTDRPGIGAGVTEGAPRGSVSRRSALSARYCITFQRETYLSILIHVNGQSWPVAIPLSKALVVWGRVFHPSSRCAGGDLNPGCDHGKVT
jgi:hypothetical protein